MKVYDEEAEKDADPYYHCSSTADCTEFYTGKGNFADDSFPDPIPGYRLKKKKKSGKRNP